MIDTYPQYQVYVLRDLERPFRECAYVKRMRRFVKCVSVEAENVGLLQQESRKRRNEKE